MITIFNSLSFIKQTGLFTVTLPNRWNIAIDYYAISVVLLFIYLPCILGLIITFSGTYDDKEYVQSEKKECIWY